MVMTGVAGIAALIGVAANSGTSTSATATQRQRMHSFISKAIAVSDLQLPVELFRGKIGIVAGIRG